MLHNLSSHVPTQYPGSANQLPFNHSSNSSKPGSPSGSKGIQLGLSSVRLIHSEREDADMSTERSSRVLTSQVETSRRALKRADKKETKRKTKPFPIVYQIGPNWNNPASQFGGFHLRTVTDD